MRKKFLTTVLASAAVAMLAVPAFAAPSRGDQMIPLKTGEVYNNEEYQVDLSDLEGFVVVVEFWATWCGPCKRSIPHLNQLHHKYKDDGLVIIGLSNEAPGKVQSFLKTMDMDYLVVAGSTSGQDYGVNGIPHAFIVDPSGKITWAGNPLNDGFDPAIEKALRDTPPTRQLGGGPEFNARLLDQMESSLRRNDMAGVLKSFNRIDHKALPEKPEHQERLNVIRKQVESAATATFDEAEASYRAKKYVEALAGFEAVAKNFAALPIAERASARIKELNRDPAVQEALKSDTLERLAGNALERAERLADRGMHVLAYKKYQSIVEKYPATEAAEAAQKKIAAYEADEEFMKELREQG